MTRKRTAKRVQLVVLNPRGIPAGRHIIKFHACADGREDPDDHGGCTAITWFEGDTFDPPDGFGLERFLRHQPMPGHTCGEDHENCAGAYLGEVNAGVNEEVTDG